MSLNTFREAQTRLLTKPSVGSVLDAGGQPWNILSELDGIGAGANPVVINGGWFSKSSYYHPLQRLLQSKGFDDVTVAQHKAHGLAPLQSDADGLETAVTAAAKRSQTGKVTVIGHSMGSLSGRLYLQQRGGIEHVDQLLTLGGPHNGHAPYGLQLTERAGRMIGLQSLRQLGRGSDEVVALNDDLPAFMEGARWLNPGFRIVSTAGDLNIRGMRRTDGLVSVDAARLDDTLEGVYNLVFQGRGAHHSGIAATFGMHEPTMRSTLMLAAGRDVADAAVGAAYVTPT